MRSLWLLLGLGLLVACPAKDKPKKPAAAPDTSASPLVVALEAALESCKLAPAGLLFQCADKALVPQLEKLERQSPKAAMATYCKSLAGGDAKRRLAAAFRLDVVHARAKRAEDAELTGCLFAAFAASKAKAEHRVLGRTLGYLAPKANKIDQLLKAVESKPEARRAVYSVLWDAGGAAVAPKLEAAMKRAGNDALLRRVLVRSLGRGRSWSPADAKAGCALLVGWARSKLGSVAQQAITLLSQRCPAQGHVVVEAIERRLTGKGGVHPVYVTALTAVGTRDAKLRDKVVTVCAGVVQGKDYHPGARTLVLRNLAKIDDKRARALAGPLARSKKTPEPLRGGAKELLASKPPKAKAPKSEPTAKK